jgi:hypothetical protein
MGPHPTSARRHKVTVKTFDLRGKAKSAPPAAAPAKPNTSVKVAAKKPAKPPASPIDLNAKRRKLNRGRLTALQWLEATYPALFDDPVVKPLAIGVGKTIVREALAAGQKRQAIGAALHYWTRARRYHQALTVPGAMRCGIDGEPVEPVSEEHRAQAAQRLAERARAQAPAP